MINIFFDKEIKYAILYKNTRIGREMLHMCIKSKENIEFMFEGPNEIDAKELSVFLNETINMFQTIVNLNDTDIPVKLNINAFEKGSFKIIATTVADVGRKIFKKIKSSREVVEAFKEVLEVKDKLKGEKPKETNEKGIILGNGEVINNGNQLVLNIYGDENKMEMIDRAIETFTKSIPDGRSLDVKDNKGTFVINEETKGNLSQKIKLKKEEKTQEKEIVESRTLIIKKPDLTMRSKWEFISDKVIRATILDEKFKERVFNKKFSIHYGQELNAKLRIKTKYDEHLEILETNYEILEVYDSEN